MISLMIIHTPFIPTTKNTMLDMIRSSSSRRHHFLTNPRSKADEGSDPDPALPKGDPKRQELLAKIAMLQTEKVRLTDFLDDRSDYLAKFAEDANAEFDAIGETALKDLDKATSRIMENMESRVQEFEESARQTRLEIEKSDKELADFEGAVEKSRNQGMFFKSFSKAPPLDDVDMEKAKEEAKKISELTNQNAASRTRKNIYIALIGVVVIGIADSVLASSVQDWKRIGVLGVILVGLVSQFVYEQSIENQGSGSSDKEKD